MIYLVTNQKQLFNDHLYKIVSPQFAINKINSLPINPKYKAKILGADTETEGLDFLTKKILTIQLGTYDWQIVWDCTSVSIHLLKTILEDKNIKTIWWNYLSNQAA